MELQRIYTEALYYASVKHRKQKLRGTKLPYLVHVVNVATEVLIAAPETPGFDVNFAIPVALLHDTIEDTETTFDELKNRFGFKAAEGVLALTKLPNLPKDDQIPDSLKRIKQLDKEVWAVKLADRIANLSLPPVEWSSKKITKYYEAAILIYDELKEGNAYLSNRLSLKIKEYEKYLVKE